MTIARASTVLSIACLVTLGFPMGAANAASPIKSGWWNVASLGHIVTPMPTTAMGDLHVGQATNGPTALAAVAYDLSGERISAALLELKVTANSAIGVPTLAICPTTREWKPAQDGPMVDAPTYDCRKHAVVGHLSARGDAVTFLLGANGQSSGRYSFAIVPATGAKPFQVDLTKPGPDSLTVTITDTRPSPVERSGAVASTEPAVTISSDRVVATAPAVDAAPTTANAPSPGFALPSTLGTAAPSPPTVSLRSLVPHGDRVRFIAGALLAVIAIVLAWATELQTRPPRMLGGLARYNRPEVGLVASRARQRGIGRFAAVRAGPPRHLR